MKAPQSDEVKDFLLSRHQHAPGNENGGKELRREWIAAVKRLYQKVTGELLAESIAQGLVTVSRVQKEITEEYWVLTVCRNYYLISAEKPYDSHRRGATSSVHKSAWIWLASSIP